MLKSVSFTDINASVNYFTSSILIFFGVMQALYYKWAQRRSRRLKDHLEEAAVKVKVDLEEKTRKQEIKINEIHVLVNSNYAVSLRAVASALQRVADLTRNPQDQINADYARQMSDDHDARQRALDKFKLIASGEGVEVQAVTGVEMLTDLISRVAKLERLGEKHDG